MLSLAAALRPRLGRPVAATALLLRAQPRPAWWTRPLSSGKGNDDDAGPPPPTAPAKKPRAPRRPRSATATPAVAAPAGSGAAGTAPPAADAPPAAAAAAGAGGAAAGGGSSDSDDDDDGADESAAATSSAATIASLVRANNGPSGGNGNSNGNGGSGGSLFQPGVPEYYPEVLALPIARKPLFPHYMKTVQVADPKVASSILRLKKRGQPYLGVFLTRDDKNDKDQIRDLNDVYPVGTFASVVQTQPFDNGGAMVLLMPHRRIRASELLRTDPFVTVKVDNLVTAPYNKTAPIIKALTQEIIATIKDIAKLSQLFREQLSQAHYLLTNTNFFDDPAQLADFAAGVTAADSAELQAVLEELVVEERLRKALVLLKKELVNARVQHDIGREVEEKLSARQREYFLNEQLKSIKKELGIEKDDKEAVVSKFREKAAARAMPEHVRKVFDEEVRKLAVLEPMSSEFNVTRNYLDWLTALPWGHRTPESLDLTQAGTVLDEDHYGLADVKERILEFIAVGKLRGTVEGKILCLVGPPGVGKTSIGKSIARTLNREFFRFSVGGLTDIAEIKGHRRTYVGAMPGKLVQCLKKTQTENPLVLIDEIDKIGRGWQGDPSSALLEMLDPEQNSGFLDHYLDVPIDLSKVLFVCTANVTDTIPGPLLDRMEVIRLSGYIADEKVRAPRCTRIPTCA
jgi:ATP-dependent Lon protease